jgi:hypothetical protein
MPTRTTESEELAPVDRPDPQPECTPHQILMGPPIDPLDRLKLYSADQFEEFIREWAFFYLQELKAKYVMISRLGGAGDKGRDVVAYVDTSSSPKVCDVFQCKHYDHALYPSDLWLELAKLCYHTHSGIIPVPRAYRFVAPQDVGPEAGLLFEKTDDLRSGLIDAWTDSKSTIPKKIAAGKHLPLEDALRAYVDAFDFSIVGYKPILEVINEHRSTIRYAPRFGGGLVKPCPPDEVPPPDPSAHETVYVECLLAAYKDNLKDPRLTIELLRSEAPHKSLSNHFDRSRERFYCAETLREFAKDSLPEGTTFEAVQDQVYDTIVDIAEANHACGFTRVCEVTKTASSMHVTNHPLGPYLKSKSLQGICHQLANLKRLVWVKHV